MSTVLELTGYRPVTVSHPAHLGEERTTNASYYPRASQLPEAVRAYEQAQQLDPTRQDAQDGLQRLQ